MSRPHIRPEGDERWIYVAHRHWIALVLRSALPFLVWLAAVVGMLWRVFGRAPDFLGRVPPALDGLNVALALVAVLAALSVAYTYVDWKNDHLIVSNKRLILEDQTLWLAFRYETIGLDRIQNVNVRVENFLQFTLKYGRVEVQAAGPTAPIVFDRVRRPDQVQIEIMREVKREKRDQEQRRLMATVQRRLNPNAPPLEVPVVPVEQDLHSPTGRWQRLVPLGPVLEGDTIIWHRHWIVLVRNLLWPALALLLWIAALVFLPSLGVVSPGTLTLGLVIALIVIAAGFYWQFEDWHNDLYILETTRLIELSRLPFGLFEDRREAPLGVIQNVNATSPNLVARIFGYGDVLVETAGIAGNFTFYQVPDPDQVQRIVFEYVDRYKWQVRERDWNTALNIVELYHQGQGGGTIPPSPASNP